MGAPTVPLPANNVKRPRMSLAAACGGPAAGAFDWPLTAPAVSWSAPEQANQQIRRQVVDAAQGGLGFVSSDALCHNFGALTEEDNFSAAEFLASCPMQQRAPLLRTIARRGPSSERLRDDAALAWLPGEQWKDIADANSKANNERDIDDPIELSLLLDQRGDTTEPQYLAEILPTQRDDQNNLVDSCPGLATRPILVTVAVCTAKAWPSALHARPSPSSPWWSTTTTTPIVHKRLPVLQEHREIWELGRLFAAFAGMDPAGGTPEVGINYPQGNTRHPTAQGTGEA